MSSAMSILPSLSCTLTQAPTMRPIVRPPDKFWPVLGLYHILNLHFPLTTFFFDAPWGRFAAQGKTWPYNWTFNGEPCGAHAPGVARAGSPEY